MTPADLIAEGFAPCEVAAPTDIGCSCRFGTTCPSPGKHPMGRSWLKRAMFYRAKQARRLPAFVSLAPVTSYGLIPMPGSGLLVIDRDDETVQLPMPETFEVHRASAVPGRGHYYFRLPDGYSEDDVPRVFAGGEVRVAGSGHVVGPKCRHSSGDTYEGNRKGIAEAPEDLLNALRDNPPVRREGSTSFDSGHVGEGQRHAWLVGQARKLAGWDYSPEAILAELEVLNDTMCIPPLTDMAELARMVDWATTNIKADPYPSVRRVKRSRQTRTWFS